MYILRFSFPNSGLGTHITWQVYNTCQVFFVVKTSKVCTYYISAGIFRLIIILSKFNRLLKSYDVSSRSQSAMADRLMNAFFTSGFCLMMSRSISFGFIFRPKFPLGSENNVEAIHRLLKSGEGRGEFKYGLIYS
jgi:hypothetical protein